MIRWRNKKSGVNLSERKKIIVESELIGELLFMLLHVKSAIKFTLVYGLTMWFLMLK